MNKNIIKKITLFFIIGISLFSINPIKAHADWSMNVNGEWTYNIENINITGWKQIGGQWYYFDNNGVMKKGGWFQDTNGKWYYLLGDGSMKTGWERNLVSSAQDEICWYYLQSDGSMAIGNLMIDGKWYCFDNSGKMLEEKNNIDTIIHEINLTLNDDNVTCNDSRCNPVVDYQDEVQTSIRIGRDNGECEFDENIKIKINGKTITKKDCMSLDINKGVIFLQLENK